MEILIVPIIVGVIVFVITTGRTPALIDKTEDRDILNEDVSDEKDNYANDTPNKNESNEEAFFKDHLDESQLVKNEDASDEKGETAGNTSNQKETDKEVSGGNEAASGQNSIPSSPGTTAPSTPSTPAPIQTPSQTFESSITIPSGNELDSNPTIGDNPNINNVTTYDAEVKGIDDLDGFVLDGSYYPKDGLGDWYLSDEPQHHVAVVFEGADVYGWTVMLTLPDGNFGVVLSSSYSGNLEFAITSGVFDLQVFYDDGQIETVYHTIVEITQSGIYTADLCDPVYYES